MGRLDNGFASEDAFQAAAAMWTWNTFPDKRRTWTHPANERKVYTKKDVIKLKQDEAKGMLIGAADFWFLSPAFCVELKQPGKKQRDDQIKCEEACKANGVPYYLLEYMDDFQRVVMEKFGNG